MTEPCALTYEPVAGDRHRQARPFAVLALIAALLLAAGCGGSKRLAPTPKSHHARPSRPEDAQCSDLVTRTAAHKLARRLVDRVVAPDGQSERQTIGVIGESLYATCRQPRIPGVRDVRAYRPVKFVLAAVQRDFDEQEITGG